MNRRIIILISLITISVLFWYASRAYTNEYLPEIFYTFTILTGIYIFFDIVLEETISRRVESRRVKHSFRLAFSLFSLMIILIAVVGIWGKYPFVSISLIIAGLAIALQDFFRNFVGGLVIFTTGAYRVGDRIEVKEKIGDVIEIGILYTTVMELKEWIAGDQETGRLTTIPNSYVLSNHVNNYTKAHSFIYDEITIAITDKSDWRKATRIIQKIVDKETKELAETAEKEISKAGEKYYIREQIFKPSIYTTLKDHLIIITIRYLTKVRERRDQNNKLKQSILKELEAEKKVKLVSV